MIGLPFITELFKNVLQVSRGIQGRFFYCPKMGAEINSADFDQVLQDEFSRSEAKKYPAVFMMPPVSSAKFVDPKGDWEYYNIKLFFLTTTYADGYGDTKDPNESTGTSTHTPMSDQHDMGRCARNFLQALNQVTRSKVNNLAQNKFRLGSTDDTKRITPISFIGVSVLSGVVVDFAISVFNGCQLEDYADQDLGDIVIPESDPHPEHNL